jgi:hypothetical protein
MSDMISELARADTLHGNYNSYHEAYAVILEELDEFWEIVREKSNRRDHRHAYNELVQLAVTCIRAARDLKLLTIERRTEGTT